MTYYGSKELADAFRTVRKNTIQIAEEIPEANYSYRITPETRSVAETLVHIAISTRFPQQVHIVEAHDREACSEFWAERRPRMNSYPEHHRARAR